MKSKQQHEVLPSVKRSRAVKRPRVESEKNSKNDQENHNNVREHTADEENNGNDMEDEEKYGVDSDSDSDGDYKKRRNYRKKELAEMLKTEKKNGKAPIGEMSEYERLRAENIARNEAFLKELGLDDIKIPIVASSSSSSSNKRSKSVSRKRNFDTEDNNGIDVRRSSRRSTAANGQGEDLMSLPYYNYDGTGAAIKQQKPKREYFDDVEIRLDEDSKGRKKITLAILRQLIDNTSEKHSNIVSNEAIQHCVMRIQSMSNAKLATRIKMIARAAGKHSCEKLLVFYYALKASELVGLASSALEALERLEGVMD